MRHLLVAAALATLASACGTASTSSVQGFPGFRPVLVAQIPQWGTAKVVKFSRDSRPADGPLVEITLTKDSRGTYTAVHHTVSAGFPPPVQDTTETLADRLTCANGFSDEQGTLTDVICSHDSRPVDGSLVQIAFSIDDNGTYAARKIITPSGFGTGDTKPRVTELDSRLALSVVDAGVDAALGSN